MPASWALAFFVIVGLIILVVSTDQFVRSAGRIAEHRHLSPVLIGAVILGCGTGLPELALAFFRDTASWHDLLQVSTAGSGNEIWFYGFIAVMIFLLSMPALMPDVVQRHSPLVVFGTVVFAASLRGSLDRLEGLAMIIGFVLGVGWVVLGSRDVNEDPWAPLIEDDYIQHGAYIEAPVMTPLQVDMTRVMLGLVGTAFGAQMLGVSFAASLHEMGIRSALVNALVAGLASVVPHVVVAIQAIRHHDDSLAIGNMIGSNLFHVLAVGGLVSLVRPVQGEGHIGLTLLGIALITALLTQMLLKTEDDLTRWQGLALMGSYLGLVALTTLF